MPRKKKKVEELIHNTDIGTIEEQRKALTEASNKSFNLLKYYPSVCKTIDKLGKGPYWTNDCQELSHNLRWNTMSNKFPNHAILKWSKESTNPKCMRPCSKIFIDRKIKEIPLKFDESRNMPNEVKSYSYNIRSRSLRRVLKIWWCISVSIYNSTLIEIRRRKVAKEPINKIAIRKVMLNMYREQIQQYHMPDSTAQYSIYECMAACKAADHVNNVKRRNNDLKGAITVNHLSKEGFIYPKNTEALLRSHVCKKKDNETNAEYEAKIDKIVKGFKIKHLKYETDSYCKVTFNRRTSKCKLVVPIKCEEHIDLRDKIECVADHTIFCDPGVSPYIAGVDTSLTSTFYGVNYVSKCSNLLYVSDNLISKATKTERYYERICLFKAAARYRLKVRNILSNMQWQICNDLTKKYRYIFLPKINTQDMVKNTDLPSTVKRAIMTASMYQFRLKLIQKCKERGNTLILCKEAWTTKTCSSCGSINKDIKAKKFYECVNPYCGLKAHRDLNAAKNIMLRQCILKI